MSSKTRISRIKGAGLLPQDGQIGIYSYPTATRGGTVFIRSLTDTSALQISTNCAQYISFKDSVDPDSDTVRFEKARGIDSGIPINKPLPCLNLVPGIEFETETYVSTGTGALTSSTAADTSLSVNTSGYICEKQGSGDASTALFKLMSNHIAARHTIEVRYVA